MKKPGLLLAAVVLAVSTNLTAATVSPNSSTLFYVPDAITLGDSYGWRVNGNDTSSVSRSAWSNTGIASQGEETSIPLPAAAWLFLSGLIGMIAVSRRKRKS